MRGRVRTALLLSAALAAPGYHAHAQSPTANAVRALQELRGLDELRDCFERDRDKIRIVLLLSPT
jgi:hypothetical protein